MAGERILVVDDGKENREFVIDYVLKPEGFQVHEARDGVEGMDMVRKLDPDLILLDLQMPRMNGIQVLEALRSENLNIPVILMTFHGSEDIAVEVFRLGVRDYVKKPYTPEEMLAAVESGLTEVRLRREKEALTNRLLNANRDLHSRIKELNMLHSIGRSLTATLSLPHLVVRSADAGALVTNAEQGCLWLLDNNQPVLRSARRRGDPDVQVEPDPDTEDLIRQVIQSGKPAVLAGEESTDENAPASILAVPILVRDKPIGALGVENIRNPARTFGEGESMRLMMLAEYAAVALENARTFAALNKS